MAHTLPLRVVSLLYDTHRENFSLSTVTYIGANRQYHHSFQPENNQEWINSKLPERATGSENNAGTLHEYKIIIKFYSNIYGTSRQAVILDFGTEPVLLLRLSVDVVPLEELQEMDKVRSTLLTQSERWCDENSIIVPFSDRDDDTPMDEEYLENRNLLMQYPSPTDKNLVFTQSSMARRPIQMDYRHRFHELLYIEELEQFNLMARYNMKTTLQITKSYMTHPLTCSTNNYAPPGELFAKLELSLDLSEDSPHGRLILSNCNSLYISTIEDDDETAKIKEMSKAVNQG